MVSEILLQAALHDLGLHHLFEHAHHHRGLVVDDIIVEQTGVIDVVDILCDGVSALRAVCRDSLGLIGLDEVESVIHLIILTAGDLRCHEVGKHLLGPYILKPFWGYEVTKPEVSSLVGNEFGTCQQFLLCGVFLKENPAGIELDGAWVLHTAKLIVGDEHDTVFVGKGVCNTCIAFQPFQGGGSLVKHLVELCHLLRVSLAVECAHLASVAGRGLLIEVSCYEGIEISGQRAAAVAGHRFPAVGHVELCQIAGPEIRLVEAWEHRTGFVGHEDRVHIVLLAIQRLVETGEAQLNLVFSRLEIFLRDDNVFVFVSGESLAALTFLTSIDVIGTVETTLEVEHHISLLFQLEGDDVLTRHLLVDVGRNVETEVIQHVGDVGIPIVSQQF